MLPAGGPVATPHFRGSIDVPVGGTSQSSHFVVRGWCYDRSGAVISAIRLKAGARLFPGFYGHSRRDVKAAYPDDANSDESGYEIPVVLSSSSFDCELQVQLTDGSWHVAQTATIHTPRRSLLEPFRWTRFWWDAWLGRRRSWLGLTEAERDFVVGAARVRGWVNMIDAPHHAPRRFVAKPFPVHRESVRGLPRIAVVTPSFEQGKFLEQTIRSVLDQRGVNIDYVIQDGGSRDGSVAVIERYASSLARWESGADDGQGDAINRGFAHVTGQAEDLMMYLNADDVLMPGAARFVAEFFAQRPAVDVVYGHRVFIDQAGNEIGRWFTPRAGCDDWRLHDFVPQETLFWRRRIWDRVGGIDPSFYFAMDWDLLLRFRAAGARFARLPWFLGAFRLHPRQKTRVRLESDGIPEMERLRRRTLGRPATHDELHFAMRRAQLDSALLCALFQRGWRA